jgi:hypothetical protein
MSALVFLINTDISTQQSFNFNLLVVDMSNLYEVLYAYTLESRYLKGNENLFEI